VGVFSTITVGAFSLDIHNQYPGFFKCGKDFPVKQLISELAVERFNITVLPGAAWFNIQGFDFYSI